MAGIYIHIPYCRQACRYCDFHFAVSVWQKNRLLPFMLKELDERSDYLKDDSIETIYFGGGTPSVMDVEELNKIFNIIFKKYKITQDPEITMEANPEDINTRYLKEIRGAGVNRLSIGIQSFDLADLELMHRIHNSEQAIRSIIESGESGFDNINVDLIYGIPGQAEGVWEQNLETAFSLGITHLSAYNMTFEEGTIFDHWRKKGRIQPVNEEISIDQFKTLKRIAKKYSFEHYEISNFAIPGYRSRHNMGYWEGMKYLGVGPSAHSYNLVSRRWNVKNNDQYIDLMAKGSDYFETEELKPNDKYNEFILTSLRTSKGLSEERLFREFDMDLIKHFQTRIKSFVKSGKVTNSDGNYILSDEGILISDYICRELFI